MLSLNFYFRAKHGFLPFSYDNSSKKREMTYNKSKPFLKTFFFQKQGLLRIDTGAISIECVAFTRDLSSPNMDHNPIITNNIERVTSAISLRNYLKRLCDFE